MAAARLGLLMPLEELNLSESSFAKVANKAVTLSEGNLVSWGCSCRRRNDMLASLLLVSTVAATPPRLDPAGFDGLWPTAEALLAPAPPPPCRAGICAGPEGGKYPTAPGIVYYSEFNVPQLPPDFGPKTQITDYLYFNIFFDSAEAQAKGVRPSVSRWRQLHLGC